MPTRNRSIKKASKTTKAQLEKEVASLRKRLAALRREGTVRKRSEEALRESEERVRLIAETITEVFWMADVEISRMLYVSHGYEIVWGRTCESLYRNPRSFLDAIHPGDRERALADLEAEKTGQPFDHEYRIIRPDGSVRWIWDRGFPVHDKSGQVTRYVGVAQDITERRRNEETLLLRAQVLDNMSEGVSFSDEHGVIRYTNPAEDAMFGYDQGELIGKHVTVLNAYPPEENARIVGAVIEQLHTSRVWQGEFWNRKKDGATFYTAAHISALEISGRKHWICVQTDITEHKRIEEALRVNVQRLRSIIEITPECVKLVASDGTLLAMNPAGLAMIGADSPDSVLGQSVYSVVAPEHREAFQTFNERICRGNSGTLQFEIVGLRGTRRWMETHAVPFPNPTDGKLEHLAITRDTTGRKRAEDMLALEKTILGTLLTEASLAKILDALCRRIEEIVEGMKCSILLLDTDGVHMRYIAAPSLPESYVRDLDGFAIGPTVGSCGTAAYCRKQVIVSDISTDPLWTDYRDVGLRNGIRACWSTPIFSAGGKVLGTFAMFYGEPRSPGEFELRLIEQVTHLSTIVIERKQTEEALRDSQARLQLAVQASNLGPWDWDLRTNTVYFSPTWKLQIGYEEHEIQGRYEEWESRLHPKDREPTLTALRAYLEGRRPEYAVEFRLRHKDGSYRWVYTRGEVLRGVDGKPFRMLGCHLDITERKRTEELLARSRDFYLSILEEFPAMIWRSGVDAKCDYFNKTWLSFTGRTLEQELGDGWAEGVHPDDVERCVGRYLQAFRAREPFVLEYRLRRYDGEYRFILDHGSPFTDLDGNFAGFIGACYDTTERKRTVEALHESEERFALAVRGSSDGLWDGRPLPDQPWHFPQTPVWWSPRVREMLGFEEQEFPNVLGSWAPLLHPDDRDRVFAALFAHIERKVPYDAEYRLRTKQGAYRWFRARGQATWNEAGHFVRMAGSLQDITERKHMEEQLRQAQKMEAIGTLAGGIAHDFNNILTAILGFTDLAMDTVPEPHRSRTDLAQVVKAGNRAKALVQQILAFSRQDKGDPIPVSLVSLITDTLPLLRATIPTTIEIRPRLEPGGSLVLADATLMQQVLINLCSNAEYAMREKGGVLDLVLDTVAVDAAFAAGHPPLQPGPHVRLTVRDTGRGMAPEILERVFDPFFTTKRLGEGTGLGLSTAHGIVTSHGGSITVASTVGGGATFEVYLPQLLASAIGQAPIDRKLPSGTERILFVDDEETLVRLAEQMLTRLGYHVVGKSNSLEALAEFRTAPDRFDLVITDQTMPKMTGEALAIELLRIRPTLPIILYTGFSHTMTPDKAAALGIRAFLMKPIVMQDLADTIRRVLGQSAGNA